MSHRTLPTLIAAHALEQPDAIAVSCGDDRLTRAALQRDATRLAQRLVAAGVRPGARVGVCLPRSTSLVTAMLAVQLAGAAYVPLDPDYPAERLRFVAVDTSMSVLIGHGAEIPGFTGVVVDPSPVGAGTEADGQLPALTGEENAYVIYTSGSTGVPKGVVIAQRNVVALVEATATLFGLGPHDVWSCFHSFAFDFSVWEIWGALATGGRAEIVPKDVARDPDSFIRLLADRRVDVLSQTPSAFSQLVAAGSLPGAALRVRLLVFGGEILDTRLLRRWFEWFPHCRVENLYGITETTVHATHRTLTPADTTTPCLSVGVALDGWEVFVLDRDGEPVGPGETGEVHVAGAGLAVGYLGRPELTAERFRLNSSLTPARRVYRTGDRGLLTASGELEVLGRLDRQVKIRGHRIELDEVRAAVLDVPGVVAAEVLGRHLADPVRARLEAYVVADRSGITGRLRDALPRRLPDFMVPAVIEQLDRLPLTPNGKVDVEALQPPPIPAHDGAARPATSGPAGQDRGHTERILARVWTDVLGVAPARESNFFHSGGTSLLAVRLRDAVRDAGLPWLAVADLYRNPTFEHLCAFVGSVAVRRPTSDLEEGASV